MKLDSEDELKEALAGSSRELKSSLEQVVYVACIATVRKGGRSALASLATHLGVQVPALRQGSMSELLGPALGSAGALTVVLFLVPMAEPLVVGLVGKALKFWPNGYGIDALGVSAVYLLAQAVPVLVAMTIFAAFQVAKPGNSVFDDSMPYVAVIAFIFVYDFMQSLADVDLNQFKTNLQPFLRTWAPFAALHTLVVVAICVFIQWRVSSGGSTSWTRQIAEMLGVVIVAALASAFYAWARMNYQWSERQPIDLLLLIVVLKAVAAAISYTAYQVVWRRRAVRMQGVVPPAALPYGSHIAQPSSVRAD